jgi:hypothetical protein
MNNSVITEDNIRKKLLEYIKFPFSVVIENFGYQRDGYNCGSFSMAYIILYILDSDFRKIPLYFSKSNIQNLQLLMMEDVKSLIQNLHQPSTVSILWIQKFSQEYR